MCVVCSTWNSGWIAYFVEILGKISDLEKSVTLVAKAFDDKFVKRVTV